MTDTKHNSDEWEQACERMLDEANAEVEATRQPAAEDDPPESWDEAIDRELTRFESEQGAGD